MKLEPIEYNGGVIWVDKKLYCTTSDYCIGFEGKLYPPTPNFIGVLKESPVFKVICQSPNLSIEGILYVEVEKDVEELAIEAADKYEWDFESHEGNGYMDFQEGFKEGYKAASAKKWSDEEVKEAIRLARECTEGYYNNIQDYRDFEWHHTEDKILQSLQKIKSIEIEMEEYKFKVTDVRNNLPNIPITYQKDGKTFLKVKQINF